MSRFFAIPFLVAVLWVVSVRWVGTSLRGEEAAPLKPAQVEPLAEETLPVAEVTQPTGRAEPEAPSPSRAPAPEAPPPSPEVLPSAAPYPSTKVEPVERTVYVTQTTVVYAPTNFYYPVEVVSPPPAEPPRTDVTEIVVVCPLHPRSCSCDRPSRAAPAAWPRAGNFMKPSVSSFMPPAGMPPAGVSRNAGSPPPRPANDRCQTR